MNYNDLNGQKLEVCKNFAGKIMILRCHKVSKMLKNNFDFQKPQIGFSKAKKNKWPYLLNYTMDFDKLFRKMPPDVHINIHQQYHIPGFCHLGNKALTYHHHNDHQNLTSLSHEI